MDKIFTKVIIYGIAIFFFVTVFWIILANPDHFYNQTPQVDEIVYKEGSDNFSINHIRDMYINNYVNKPLTFLILEKIFASDIFLTRMLNLLLVIINTFLIYKLTKNKFSFLYFVFPVLTNSMWLTVEIIEAMFLLLGLCYKERNGIFVGLATIFRPYSILYTILLSKKQIFYVIIVGAVFSVILLILGLFFPYFFNVISYTHNTYGEVDFLLFVMLGILFIIGCRNRLMLKYSIIAMVPLYMRSFGHYFLPVYTFLFVGFLLSMNEDFEELNIKYNKV